MVVNHRLKFCFVENPKCASTYVAEALIKLDGSRCPSKKHLSAIEFLKRRSVENPDEYKVFTTVRNPLSLYPSLYSFAQRSPESHVKKFFPQTDFDSFLDAQLSLKAEVWKPGAFQRYFGQPIEILDGLNYGWVTFSTIYWTSRGVPNFEKLDSVDKVTTFRVEDDFRSQIEQYLGLGIKWPEDKLNSTPRIAELSENQENLIRLADSQVFNLFGYQ